MDVYRGTDKVAEFESYDELRVGDGKPAFIYEGSELVYPNPVKDGLVLWYDFSGRTNDDAQRNVAEDLSGNGNHGTMQNFNFTPESGYDKNKLLFDGVDDYLEIPELNLDETGMTVGVDGKVYAYEDDKVVTVGEDGGIEFGGKNLVKNSNFATGTADGWGKESGTHRVSFSKEVYRSGGYSWKFEGDSAGNANFSDYVDAKEGEIYSFSFYGLLTGEIFSNYSTRIRLVFLNESGTELKEHILYIRDLIGQEFNKWHLLKSEGIEAPEDTKYVSVHLRWWGVDDAIYIDEIMLTRDSQIKNWTPAPEDFKTTTLSPSSMRNLYMYNRPLTPEEIQHNYQIEKARFNLGGDDL